MSNEPLKLVVVGNQVQMQRCSLYKHLHPMTQKHHVCPESWWERAGKPVTSPLMSLCPDCHYGVHVCIDGLIRGRELRLMPKRWVQLAQRAIELASQYGLTPSPTL